jgi:hypothetical protein
MYYNVCHKSVVMYLQYYFFKLLFIKDKTNLDLLHYKIIHIYTYTYFAFNTRLNYSSFRYSGLFIKKMYNKMYEIKK